MSLIFFGVPALSLWASSLATLGSTFRFHGSTTLAGKSNRHCSIAHCNRRMIIHHVDRSNIRQSGSPGPAMVQINAATATILHNQQYNY